jgi:hypothetical protein
MESEEERRGLPPADRIPSAQRPKKRQENQNKEEYREKHM